MDGGGWLWLVDDIIAPTVFGVALIYCMAVCRRRPLSPAAERAQEMAVRENYAAHASSARSSTLQRGVHAHGSLGPRGFMVLMAAVCAVGLGTGLRFYMDGAWPVIGFLGIAIALMYVAFRLNFRALTAGAVEKRTDTPENAIVVTEMEANEKRTDTPENPIVVTEMEARQAITVRGMVPVLVISTVGSYVLLACLYIHYFGWPL